MMADITIVGNGSWATALVKLFTEAGVKVYWLMRKREYVDYIRIKGYNPNYLSHVTLKKELIVPTIEAPMALRNSGLVIFAVPSAYLKQTLDNIDIECLLGKRLAVSIKGLIPGAACTPSRYVQQFMGINDPLIILSGPCHAEEIAQQRCTYLTISGEDQAFIHDLCKCLQSSYLHTIPNYDPVGVEYTAILKNIIAIATGIAHGLHYGDNFQSVLVANAMHEIEKFLGAIDPKQRNLSHSAYFGDLLVTAYSDYSRNRTLGKLIGRGIHVNGALHAMEMIAEGFHASRELIPITDKLKITMPVTNAVQRILHQHANPFHEFKLLEQQLS